MLAAVCLYGDEDVTDLVENPHFDPSRCSVCHDSISDNEQNFRYGENVTQLCLWCHDGQKAISELHPAELTPSMEIVARMPRHFPLDNGRLSCLTCHDVSMQCNDGPQNSQSNGNFLRGDTRFPAFCFQCHTEETEQPFNAHDQIDDHGQPKENVCLWCHVEVPEVKSFMKDSENFALRDEDHILCRNCHTVDEHHPAGGKHILVKPSEKILRDMAHYIGIPPEQYSDFQVFPLDNNGRITCFSCHNPHERGLFPGINLRSLGAEPVRAVYNRLRRKKSNESQCKACHNY